MPYNIIGQMPIGLAVLKNDYMHMYTFISYDKKKKREAYFSPADTLGVKSGWPHSTVRET